MPVLLQTYPGVGDNDLATVNPALAAQWDTAKNGALRPSDVLAGSQQYVWWRCEKVIRGVQAF